MKDKQQQPGFEVPDAYFERLEERVLMRVNRQDNQGGFKVPQDYFDQLDQQVMERIEDQKLRTLKSQERSKLRVLWNVGGLAAAVLLVLVIGKNFQYNNSDWQADSLEDETIATYVEEVAILQEEEDIEFLFTDNTILNDISMAEDISDKELLAYLEDEVSLTQIMRE
ncbi:hypothetical protein [Nonlabens xiamenensis]|uniref:hypothetical protein n=1 Tax=Nonlabens xiamenensis TaxID=2341043 RepID=UPI000F610D41|nr:hypothetical protein [Nonlabens xiamenensis]